MRVHYQRARLLLTQGRYEQAERELRQDLAENPHDGHVHALLGHCLTLRKRTAEALAVGVEAVRVAPDLPYAHYMLGLTYDDCGRLKDAEAALREALRLDPKNAERLNWLSCIQYRRGELRAALETVGRGLEIDPRQVSCLNGRGLYLRSLGDWEESEAVLRIALARDPTNAYTHTNLAWTLRSKACALVGKLDPRIRPWAISGRREWREALEHFREGLRLAPCSEWARESLKGVLHGRWKMDYRPGVDI